MLRGVTEVKTQEVQKPTNETVGLTAENIPPHQHNSGITDGITIGTAKGSVAGASTKSNQGLHCDMFYNDSLAGLSNNEMDGVVDDFSVNYAGQNQAKGSDEPIVYHNNMPVHGDYYAFVVRKN